MHSPLSSRSLENCRRCAQLRPIILVIGILLAVGVAWFSSRLISQKTLLKKLPALPNLAGLHQSLRDQILRLDAEVRANPRSVEKIVTLGLTYHANESLE